VTNSALGITMSSAFQNSWSEYVRGGRSDLGVRVVGTWGRVQRQGQGHMSAGRKTGPSWRVYSTLGPLPNRRIS
jgi:hypothetical protein